MIVLFSTKKKKGFTDNKGNFLWVTGGHNSVDGCPLPLEATGWRRRWLGQSPLQTPALIPPPHRCPPPPPARPSSAHPGSSRHWASVEWNKNARFQVLQGRGTGLVPEPNVSPPFAKPKASLLHPLSSRETYPNLVPASV